VICSAQQREARCAGVGSKVLRWSLDGVFDTLVGLYLIWRGEVMAMPIAAAFQSRNRMTTL
jgi:hypothetical protein